MGDVSLELVDELIRLYPKMVSSHERLSRAASSAASRMHLATFGEAWSCNLEGATVDLTRLLEEIANGHSDIRLLEKLILPLGRLTAEELATSTAAVWMEAVDDGLNSLAASRRVYLEIAEVVDKAAVQMSDEILKEESGNIVRDGNTLKKLSSEGRLGEYSPTSPYHLIDDHQECRRRNAGTFYTAICHMLFVIEVIDRVTSAIGNLVKLFEIKK